LEEPLRLRNVLEERQQHLEETTAFLVPVLIGIPVLVVGGYYIVKVMH
jgi:hypothetical protein